MVDATAEVSAFFETAEATLEAYERLERVAGESFRSRDRLADMIQEYRERVERGQGAPLKLALGLFALGRFQETLEWLGQAPDGKLRRFFAARAALALGRLDAALDELQAAATKGWDRCETDLLAAAIHVRKGDLATAAKLANKYTSSGQDRADWHYVQGLLQEHAGDWQQALTFYDKAWTLDPGHVQAGFRLAWLYDLHGEDQAAIQLYEQLAHRPCAHVNALINLAVIYEDNGQYDQARAALMRVLKAYPDHPRARLFLKDVESCREMVSHTAGAARGARRNRLLDLPISEYELSSRTRNSLKKMNVNTLGDLVHLNEAELLSLKNFGDTALAEIKALLAKRGLRLGQPAGELPEETPAEPTPPPPVPPGRQALLAKPVAELELSVRARRCLQRLNVATLGDLLQFSEADLLATRNFGVTSLTEVKARLAEYGLTLAQKRPE